jgi:predicted O-linked N-acetylglucosamine transferase (SPINDLY family)
MATIPDALTFAVQQHQAGRLQSAEQVYRQILEAEPEHADALHLLGLVSSQTGNQQLAVDLISRALGLRPDWPEANYNLGNALRGQRKLDAAIARYRQALALKPDYAEAHVNLGNALKDQGNPECAVASYRRALELRPDLAVVYNNLGTALQSQQKLDEAVASYARALELTPDFADAHNNLGTVFSSQGKPNEAIACYRRALELKPDFADAHNNLGTVFSSQGKTDAAIACYRRALELNPDYAEAHNNLGHALREHAKLEDAVASCRRALELNPGLAEAHLNLGNISLDLGTLHEAIECYQRALAQKPDYADAHNNMGNALEGQGKLNEAIECYQRVLRLRPDHAEVHNNMGSALKGQGKLDEAIAWYRRAVELKPEYAAAHSNLLYALHYRSGVTPAELADAHAVYDRQHAVLLRSAIAPRRNLRDRSRRLRVGFVSPNLGRHPVGFFLVRVLENLSSDRLETICYSDRILKHDLTYRLHAAATAWRDVIDRSDERLADQIRSDGIDILFDLAGHTGHNRLLVFARKPAPIQITWIGYEGTTGLEAMDYLLADRHVVPQGSECFYREQVLRMPDGYLCYDPPKVAPPVGPLPALKSGSVTFGSFNNPAKITPEVVAVWAAILRAAPTARLIMKYRGLGETTVKQRFLDLFAAQGVEPRRLELQPWSSYADYLATYQQVDLALDPFPFSGSTITCESLWMGVPVITCPGATFASRHSLTHLSNTGLTETIARNFDEYVRLAVSLAGDLTRLAALRAGLRERMAASPLCDGKRFATGFASLLSDVWDRWNPDDAGKCRRVPESRAELGAQTCNQPLATLRAAIGSRGTINLFETWKINIAHIITNEHGPIFSELIDLLADAFRQLGIDVIVSQNQVLKERLNIVVGSTVCLPAEKILEITRSGIPYAAFQSEALHDHEGFVRGFPHYMEFLKGAASVWDYNQNNIEYLLQHGCANVSQIQLGNCAALERIPVYPSQYRDIDVLFCGSMTGRRRFVIQALQDSGIKVECLFGVYGQARDQRISRSQIILNLHQFDTTQLEQVRISYLLNNKCFVISESSDCNPYGDGVVFARYEELVDCCKRYLAPGMAAERERIAQIGYAQLKSFPMLQQLKSALARHAADTSGKLDLKPDYAESQINLGSSLLDQGNVDDAIACYRRALEARPDLAVAHNNLGNALKAQGKIDEAIASYRRALERQPDYAKAHNNLGNALTDQGKLDEAVAACRRALQLEPDFAEAHNNLGNAHMGQGKFDAAVACYRRALELKPGLAEAHNNLGTALWSQKKLDEAVACYRRALELNPDYGAHCNLGNALRAQGKLDEAVACYQRALELRPDYAGAHSNLGNAFWDQGKLNEAAACYHRALELRPDYAEAHCNLGNVFTDQWKLAEAIACYRRALELMPDLAAAHNNLGTALTRQANPVEAIGSYRRALELKPDYAVAHSSLLMTLQFCTGVTPAALAEAHAAYDHQHAAPLRGTLAPHEKSRVRKRSLRVGFVSPDLGWHPVGYFLVRLFENLNPQRLKTICFSDRFVKDDLTCRLQAAATEWRDVADISDERLADQIRADRIDILFDLAGHTGHNRLLVFARKPAPIQITWAGYVGTTGLQAMDYLLADRYEVPPGTERHYQERVLRMPDGYVCYDPPAYAPPVTALPALDRGHITLGCFNNPAKITPQVIEVWAQILHRLPGARLVLKFKGGSDSGVIRRFTETIAAQGIDPGRVELRGSSPHAEFLAEYQRIDLALDPFPYSGGLTTCESLWMGVPVITCPGETFASRHSLSHLSSVGLTETIARDLDEYVELAVSLAGDWPRLAALRVSLRERMAASPLCDGTRFATNFASLLGDVWDRWNGEPWPDGGLPRVPTLIEKGKQPISFASSPPAAMSGLASLARATIAEGTGAIPQPLAIAIQQHQAGRLQAAEQAYRQILAADPNHADAWHLLGVVAQQVGRRATAVEYIQRAIHIHDAASICYENLAVVFRSLGRLDEAVECYQRILEINPACDLARRNLQQVQSHQRMNESLLCAGSFVAAEVLDSWMAQARDIGMVQVDAEILSLCEFFQDKRLNHVMEIGSRHGGTFFLWCRLAKGRKISLDVAEGGFGGLHEEDAILRNESMQHWAAGVYPLLADSHDPSTLERVRRILEHEMLDLLFIDGDHTYEGVKADYEIYSDIVKPGGYIAFHDIVDSQQHRDKNCFVARFWNELRGEKFEFNTHGVWGGIGVVRTPVA